MALDERSCGLEGEQIELAREFARRLTCADNGERLPYTLAVHRGKGENPHAHLMISERANDGIERDAAQWFRALQRQGHEYDSGGLGRKPCQNGSAPASLRKLSS